MTSSHSLLKGCIILQFLKQNGKFNIQCEVTNFKCLTTTVWCSGSSRIHLSSSADVHVGLKDSCPQLPLHWTWNTKGPLSLGERSTDSLVKCKDMSLATGSMGTVSMPGPKIKSFLSLSSKSVEQQEQRITPSILSPSSLLPYPGLWLLALSVKLKTEKAADSPRNWANSIVSSCKWKWFFISGRGKVWDTDWSQPRLHWVQPVMLWNQRLSWHKTLLCFADSWRVLTFSLRNLRKVTLVRGKLPGLPGFLDKMLFSNCQCNQPLPRVPSPPQALDSALYTHQCTLLTLAWLTPVYFPQKYT